MISFFDKRESLASTDFVVMLFSQDVYNNDFFSVPVAVHRCLPRDHWDSSLPEPTLDQGSIDSTGGVDCKGV